MPRYRNVKFLYALGMPGLNCPCPPRIWPSIWNFHESLSTYKKSKQKIKSLSRYRKSIILTCSRHAFAYLTTPTQDMKRKLKLSWTFIYMPKKNSSFTHCWDIKNFVILAHFGHVWAHMAPPKSDHTQC